MKKSFKLVSLFCAMLALTGCTATGGGGGVTPTPTPDPEPEEEEKDYNKGDYNPIKSGEEGFNLFVASESFGGRYYDSEIYGCYDYKTFSASDLVKSWMPTTLHMSQTDIDKYIKNYDSTFFKTHVLYYGVIDLPETCSLEFMKIWKDSEMEEVVGKDWDNHDDASDDRRYMSFYYTYKTEDEFNNKNRVDKVGNLWFLEVECDSNQTPEERLTLYPGSRYAGSSGFASKYPKLELRKHYIVTDELKDSSSSN